MANLKEHGVDKGRYLRDLSLQIQSDEQELTQMKEDRLKYLQKAVKNYIRCLQVGVSASVNLFCYSSPDSHFLEDSHFLGMRKYCKNILQILVFAI